MYQRILPISFWVLLLACAHTSAVGQTSPAASSPTPGKVLFDFETQADVAKWSPVDAATKPQEPAASVAMAAEGVTSGSHSMKITFKGGMWPAVGTTLPSSDWSSYNALEIDVTAGARCVVGVRARGDKADPKDPEAWWAKTSFISSGSNHLVMPIKASTKFSGKDVIAVEVFMYKPDDGQSLLIDNIRLVNVKPAKDRARQQFAVLGTDWKVTGPEDIAAKLKALAASEPSSSPADDSKTIEQVEAAFAGRCDEIRKVHPRAAAAILRDGQKGWDPAVPDKVFDGWKDTLVFTHPPDNNVQQRSRNFSQRKELPCYGRNVGSRMLQVDLSVIPKGSKILYAQFVLVRHVKGAADADHYLPTAWVAEACNRDWDEKEINGYQYAKGKLWKEFAGASYEGDDPDFLPLYVAFGPAGGRSNVVAWDFTEAVRFWTDGKHPNYGFFWYDAYTTDFWRASPTRRADNIKDRPAMMVIYEPVAGG